MQERRRSNPALSALKKEPRSVQFDNTTYCTGNASFCNVYWTCERSRRTTWWRQVLGSSRSPLVQVITRPGSSYSLQSIYAAILLHLVESICGIVPKHVLAVGREREREGWMEIYTVWVGWGVRCDATSSAFAYLGSLSHNGGREHSSLLAHLVPLISLV